MKKFGKYLLIRKVASGGMADVFKAKALGIRGFTKTLAIKRIHPHLTDDARFVRMFTDEAKIAAALLHSNIVQIYDLGETEGIPYIAMEYVPGRDLLEVVRRCHEVRRRFPVALACKVVSEVCDGLNYAHEFCGLDGLPLEIVHRDVTPRNILIGFNGTIKLTDFGVARARQREEKTEAGLIKGKVRYLSPEAAKGLEVDRRSDIFSLGLVFIELLTMRPFFDQENELEVLLAISEGKLPTERFDEIPERLVGVIKKALITDRESRFSTAKEMKEALQSVAGDEIEQVGPYEVASAMHFLFSKEIEDERYDDQRIEEAIVAKMEKSRTGRSIRPSPVTRPGPPPMPPDAREESLESEHDVIPLSTDLENGDTGSLEVEILTPVPDPRDINPSSDARSWEEVDVTDAAPDSILGASPSKLFSLENSDSGPIAAPEKGKAEDKPGQKYIEPGGIRPVPPSSQPQALDGTLEQDGVKPDFEGDLARTSLVHVFHTLAEEKSTGRLDVKREPVQKAIFFKQGEPLFATSNVEAELFGEHIISKGILSRDAVEKALGEAALKHVSLTAALLAMGLLAPHDLYRHLLEQVRDKILDLFSWVSGQYAFYAGIDPPSTGYPLGLNAYSLLLEGIREHVSGVIIKRSIEPYYHHLVLRTGGALPADLRLSGKEQRILNLVGTGGKDLGSLMTQSMNEELTFKVIYLLKEIRRITFVSK
ncbi:MAG: protein kinase [Deltaproteobacteria bacterium]|nr:protein kinase [Deltaproteobacteria bacterium]